MIREIQTVSTEENKPCKEAREMALLVKCFPCKYMDLRWGPRIHFENAGCSPVLGRWTQLAGQPG